MLVLQALNLQKSFGRQEVLRGVSLAVNEKERVGLVGVNGSGKTTLLKCLSGEVWPDSGEVHRSSSLSLACLEQISEFPHGITAWEAVMDSFSDLINMRHSMRSLEAQMASGDGLDRVLEKYARINEAYERANGYACENMTRRILSGLGFSPQEYDQPLDTFSGGQKSRLKLGRLLATAPDILLLDEPTNHLDMPSVEWLEDYIRNYAGTVVLVSHDRMFLDTVATRIVELRGGHLRSFPGNYSHYLQARAEQDLAWQKAYEKQQEYIRATEAYIRRFKAGIKSRQARGRQSQLDRLQRIPAVDHRQSLSRTRIAVKHSSAHDVLSLEGICKSFAEREVLKNVDLRIEKGDRLALIGPNGCGKAPC
jgi:ATP-binding cassette subfamily F protein 3